MLLILLSLDVDCNVFFLKRSFVFYLSDVDELVRQSQFQSQCDVLRDQTDRTLPGCSSWSERRGVGVRLRNQ